jgi:hypothetical protein
MKNHTFGNADTHECFWYCYYHHGRGRRQKLTSQQFGGEHSEQQLLNCKIYSIWCRRWHFI